MPRIAVAVRDFASAVATFGERLGMPVFDLSRTSVESLGAKLAMCAPEGGSHIELMSPASPLAPLSRSLQRFLDRRGEGLFALMLEAPDPDAAAERLSGRGLHVLPLMPGAGGRDIHPRSTHGVLIRVYPVGSFRAPRDRGPGGDRGPSRLSGVVRVIIAVQDLDRAVTVYGDALGLDVDEPSADADRGVRWTTCRPPSGGAIELVSVVDPSRPFARAVAGDVEGREGMAGLVLRSRDPRAAARSLVARGLAVRVAADAADVWEVDPTATFGARLRVERAPDSRTPAC